MSIPRKHDARGVPIHPGEFCVRIFFCRWTFVQCVIPCLRVPVTRISEIVRSAGDYGGYGAASGAVFWNHARFLDEDADVLRSGAGQPGSDCPHRGRDIPAPRTETGHLKARQVA